MASKEGLARRGLIVGKVEHAHLSRVGIASTANIYTLIMLLAKGLIP